MNIRQYDPPHPGGFLKRVYLQPFRLNINKVAMRLKVNPSTLSRLINERSDLSPRMALKLSKVIGRSPESWLLMQDKHNLWKAKKMDLSSCETIKFF